MSIINHDLWVNESHNRYNIFYMPTNKAYEIIWKLTSDIVHCFHRGDPEFQKYFVKLNSFCEKKLVDCNDSELKFIYRVIHDRFIKEFNEEHRNDTYKFEECNHTTLKY